MSNSTIKTSHPYLRLRHLWLSLLMLLVGTNSTLAQNVAKVGTTEYATLQAAVDAAQQSGGSQTINLIGNVSGETVTIQEVANFKLTIDGKKDDSSNYTVDAVIVVDGLRGDGGSTTNGASVTLQNIAFVKTTATDGIQASHYPHHLTIQDCTYSGSDNDKWFLNASVDCPLYGVTVKNVTVEHARLIYANMADDAVFQNITATNDVKVGFNVKTSGTALIENCQVTTGKYAFRDYSDAYDGTFTLKDNTFISTSTASDEGVIVNRGGAVGTAHIKVESGTYKGSIKVLNNIEGVLALSVGTTFSQPVDDYIASGLISHSNGDGTFTVQEGSYVAQVGTVKYDTLEAAFAAVNDGGTVTLLDDVTLSGNLELALEGKSVTLDLGAKTLNGRTNLKSGNLTVTNGTVNCEGGQPLNVYGSATAGAENYSVLTIANDVTVSGDYGVCMFGPTASSKAGYGAVVNIAGTLNGTKGTVFVSGNLGNNIAGDMNNVVNITGKVNGNSDAGVALNGNATVNVKSGAEITGNTGIAIKRGVLNVEEGATIHATGTENPNPDANNNGTEMTGAAISMTDTYNNYGAMSVNITGGTITSDNTVALFKEEGTYANAATYIVSGGTFSSAVPAEFCADGYIPTNLGDGKYSVKVGAYVAKIGDVKYETLAEAVSAANAGETIEVIVAGDYKLPNLPKNVTIEGKADGVVSFTYTTANSSIASVPNGATFKNVTFNWGDVNYHGFQEAGTINMENCKHNGRFFSYGNMNFTNCEFEYSGNEYCMWVYDKGEVVYDQCTFTNNTKGKLLHLYCEGTNLQHKVTVKDCKFVNGGELSKSAVNVKATSTNGALQYELHLEGNNTYEGNFPTAVGEQANADHTWILSPLAQVDDRSVDPDKLKVWADDVLIYPVAYVAQIGTQKYVTLEAAFAAVNDGETITMLDDVTLSGNLELALEGKSVTLDLGAKTLNGRTNLKSGNLTVTNGTVNCEGGQPLNVYGSATAGAENYSVLTIANDVTVSGDYGVCMFGPTASSKAGYGAVVNIAGTLNGTKGTVFVSGNLGNNIAGDMNNVVNITGKVNGNSDAGVALNGNATVNVKSGAEITGNTGIAIKRGVLNVEEGATIHATGTENPNPDANNNGTEMTGAAISMTDTYNNYGAMSVNITGGTITSDNTVALFKEEGTYANAATYTVSGGTFNSPVPEEFCAEGYIPTNLGDGKYSVKVGEYVAKIGDVKYETLQDALDAAEAEDIADIVIDLLGNATLDITAWSGTSNPLSIGTVNTKSITINGNDKTLTFNQKNSDWNNIATMNDDVTKLVLNNMAITSSGHNDGPWNRHDINFSCAVELNNVTSDKAFAFKNDATLKNVTVTDESGSLYGIWVQPNGQNISIDGLTVTAERGIKIDDQYVDEPQQVTMSIANATFNTTKKSAILVKSAANTVITAGEGIIIANVAADKDNLVWVDEDRAEEFYKVAVNNATIMPESKETDYVACLMNGEQRWWFYKGTSALSKAIDKVEDGYSIKLFQTTAEAVEVSKPLVITKNGYTADNVTAADGFVREETETEIIIRELDPVAKIGDVTYKTLQKALDAAHEMTGDVTVELIANIEGYSIVHQKAGLNLTIDGAEKTVNGQIIIDGDGALDGTDALTIKNIKFEMPSELCTGTDAFVVVPSTKTTGTPYYDPSHNNHAHNITISDCTFTGNYPTSNMVGFKSHSGIDGMKNLVMENVTATNLHSLAQLTATKGATFDNCTATQTGSFIGANGGDGSYTVSNCTFESHPDKTDGYAYREKSGSTAVATLTNNNFKAHDAIILGSAGTINVESGTYVGEISKTAGAIVISDGKFSAPLAEAQYAEFIAEGKCGVNGLYPEEELAKNGIGTAVATVTSGETVLKYASLEAAFAAAPDGATVTLLTNSTGNGIKVPEGKYTTGLTVDFGGFTYTMDGEMVGSTGTETQAFQLLKGNKITFKNGTIYSEKAYMLVQNYSDLTLEGMILTLDNEDYTEAYTLSNNNGNIVIDGSTINANPAGSTAFDVCRYSSYPSVSVTVKGASVINGDVEVDAGGGDPKEGMHLTVEGGTFNGNLRLTNGGATAITDTPDKAVVTKKNGVTIAAPADFKWKDNGDGTSTLVPCVYVAQIGDVKYESLADAVAAVPTDGTETTITMIANHAVEAGVTIAAGKNVVLELNGKTVSGNTDSSKTYALITNKGTLVIQDNTDTNVDGTGEGLITTYIANPDGGDIPGYASNTITNNGNLTVKSGKIVNNGNGYACYAIDNQTNGTLYSPALKIEGGRMQQMNAYTYAVRMFCNSTTNVNSVEVSGGVIEGGYGLWLQTPNAKANMASLNISGGTFNANDGAALYIGGTKADNSKISINISGGTINGTGAIIQGPLSGTYGDVAITDGKIVNVQCGANVEKFISGGVYKIEVNEAYCAEGYIPADNLDEATKAAYPYTVKQGQYVAQIGDVKYETLEAAFAAANDGETIMLLADCTGNGIVVPQGKYTTGLTVDFDGHTYTMDGEMVGSTGTETQAFQLLKDNKITFKGGTITSEKAKMLVQNYSDLTLEGMTLTLSNANYTLAYTLSNNNGNIVIDGSTINANPAGSTAFDVCRYSSYPSVNVTVKGASVINGDVEIDAGNGDPKDGLGLTVEGGTFNGNLRLTNGGATAITDTPDKAVVTKKNDVDIAAPADFKWKDNGDGTSTLVPCVYVAQIGDVKYESLADAVAAVPTDGTETTITMIASENINVVGSAVTIANNKNVVLDLNGFQVVGTASEGATSALITNKGTLTIKDSSDTNKDGTGTGQLISGATTTWIYEGDGNYAGSYASNTITNSGTLTVESGYIENLSTGSATYAVDNNSSGADAILNVNGGKLKAHSVAVRQFANSTANENVVNVSAGALEAGYSAIWIQLPGSNSTQAVKASLNVTGGTLTGGSFAFYDYSYGNSFDATQYNLRGGTFNGDIFSYGANINITDGTYNGEVAIKQAKPSNVAVSGGKFAGDVYTYGDNASEGFITGGVYATKTYEYDGNTYNCDWMSLLADGFIVTKNHDEATKENYPYAVKSGIYVAQIGDVKYGSLAEAVDDVPTDGTETTITLLANVEEDVVLGGGKNIVLNLAEKTLTGYIDQYDTNLNVKNGTIAGTVYVNGGATETDSYNHFTLDASATITSDYGIILYQAEGTKVGYGSTIDINGTVNGMVWVMGNIENGNSVINVNSGAKIKGDVGVALNGLATVNVKEGATIEGSEVGIEARAGNLNVEGGNITSTATEYSVTPNGSGTTTTGAAIAVAQHTTKLATNVVISGGTLTGVKTISVADPQGLNLEGVLVTVKDELIVESVIIPDAFVWVSNNDGTSTLRTKESQIFELIDGEPYEFAKTGNVYASKVTYKRTFNDDQTGKYQCWYIPVDYTITGEEDAVFYKIDFIAALSTSGMVEDENQVYLYIQKMKAGDKLYANRPYIIKANSAAPYEFISENVTLYKRTTDSRMHLEKSTINYDFYGTYDTFKASTGQEFLSLNKLNEIVWNKSANAKLDSYRWYIKPSSKLGGDYNYTKIRIDIVADEDVVGISNQFVDESEIEGYYSLNGTKLAIPVQGANIVKYKNGMTKKIFIK